MSVFDKAAIVEGAKISGLFDVAGRTIAGELVINGADTEVYLHDDAFFHCGSRDRVNLTGELIDRRKVTLVDCTVISDMGSTSRGDRTFYHATLRPHFVISGDCHLDALAPIVSKLSFHIDDAENIFYDFDALGHVIDARAVIDTVVSGNERVINRKIPIGDQPRISYFAGRLEIASVETAIGKISIRHRPYDNMFSSPAGVWIRNHILVDVAFSDSLSLSAALDHVMTLLRFFELIGGRPQNIDMINIAVGVLDQEIWLGLYWCLPPKRRNAWEHRPPHPSEILVDAVEDRAAFEQVLSSWIAQDDDRLQARVRFSRGFGQQRSFSIDRLVGAANMFDILPPEALPEKISLSDEVKRAKQCAREMFKALPASDERDTILNALGRLGSRTLRQKIRHRAHIANSAMLQPLASLDDVVDEAVKCRNHFVHGSPGSFDYFVHGGTMNFLTSALEFLFAAADLVDAGWDATAWQQRGGVLAHPFSETLYQWDRCALQIVELRANPDLAPTDE